jgi:hypothetical protein
MLNVLGLFDDTSLLHSIHLDVLSHQSTLINLFDHDFFVFLTKHVDLFLNVLTISNIDK